ncbi:amine oxidase, flavin-containing superfamily [Aspergillus nomiae NRRL 13137]|uniref:Amine oxidase, flavin-containing superfamily n=1 Tax=Aspergillus nomiae NRRL (strain ATCC 15546 / NRRL 13137 / CBS 260.88 / M93) TaxID=1509407 RepID=A0A0L1J9E1_ASPN3|nr:amine oxidase, flavin-containing superfamily [Aspergillus nomiae NRRL 13137]KNG88347.1 amine oxidase, flavin-containing superfamily [Aspergillus nomiae NRRL 13137]
MRLLIATISLVLSALSWLDCTVSVPRAPPSLDLSQFEGKRVITRDVCIIGGGSAGTYAAIRLRQMNQSVVLVEKEDHLGGHVNTYDDPETETAVDYGVLYYENLPLLRDYFDHFDIPLEKVRILEQNSTQRRVDLRTGTPVGPAQGNMYQALTAYSAQLLKYPYLNTGFNLPNPVPPDLLLPFGEFVKKYELEGAVDIIAMFNQGAGDILQQTTLYMLKYFGLGVVQSAFGGFLVPASRNNSELYGAAREELGEDVLLNSTVTYTHRNDARGWAYAVVQTPSGVKVIRARKLIIVIQPRLDMLKGMDMDLDDSERELFGQFNNTCYYTALARIPGLPEDMQIVNRATDTLYQLPPQPAVYVINTTREPGLFTILYGSKDHMTEAEVKGNMTLSVMQLRKAGIPVEPPEFVRYSDHSPFLLTVPPDAIRNGFYRRLNNLQGHRKTYYMSATFDSHDSARIWSFIDGLLKASFS